MMHHISAFTLCLGRGGELSIPTLSDVSRAVRTSAVPIVGVAHLLYAHMRMAPIAPRVSGVSKISRPRAALPSVFDQ